MKKDVKKVVDLLSELGVVRKNSKGNVIKRIGGKKFRELVHVLATDTTHEAEKYFFKNGLEIVEKKNLAKSVNTFIDKLLKKAGLKDENERAAIIAGLDLRPSDCEFIIDVYEEAAYSVIKAGKTHAMFNYKPVGLSFTEAERQGKYAGKKTIKRKVNNRREKLAKALEKAKK